MEITCQRCHETLRDADRYCPVCGLPQLMYVAAEVPQRVSNGDDGEDREQAGRAIALDADSEAGQTGGISWRPALQAALLVGIPAGVLCSEITPLGPALGLFWMICAAAWAVSLYVRRTRLGWLSMGNGARIGLVTGLLASWLTLSVDGVYLWFERFVMHQGAQMDALWLAQVQESQQMFAEMSAANPESLQVSQSMRAWMLSIEGHAGWQLWGLVMGAAFLTMFSVLGGVMGARFLTRRGRPSPQR